MTRNKVGRKSIYETKIKARFKEIESWLSKGATERSVANKLGIAYSTFNKYKAEKKEFMELLNKGRDTAVDDIENAMFESAIGGVKTLKKPLKVKRVEYDNGKRLLEEENIVQVEEEIFVPLNTTAAIYLLKHWGGDRGYTSDPQTLKLKQEELELKKKQVENNDW